MLLHYLKRTALLVALLPSCMHAQTFGNDTLTTVENMETALSSELLASQEEEAGMDMTDNAETVVFNWEEMPELTVATEGYQPKMTVTDSIRNYNFRLKQIALPVSLIGVGAIALAPTFIKNGSHAVTNEILSWRGNKRRKSVDDYIQYLPVASQLLLGLTGIKARHNLRDRVLITATSYATLALLTNVPKLLIDSKRPQFAGHNSFPSGHTATAFMGAELMRIEYGPWYGLGAYAVATCVGFMRMYNGRHWLNDVIAGAGVGILSARVGEWSCALWQKILPHNPYTRYWSLVPTYQPYGKGQYGLAMNWYF